MRKLLWPIAISCVLVRGADWPTANGSPQRDGWAKSETAFTKENVKGLELLYKHKSETAPTTPIVNGRLITYLGFKEMLVFAGSSDMVSSVDADLNRLIWKVHLDAHATKALAGSEACSGDMAAPVAMAGGSTTIAQRGVRPVAAPGSAAQALRPNRGGEFFALSSDGYLHVINTSTGEDRSPAVKFVPPNSRVSALNISDNVIYAATLDGCGGKPDTLYALDLSTDDGKVVAQPAQGGSIVGTAGTAIGLDGLVYAQVRNLHGDLNDAVFALHPKTLAVKDYFLVKNNVADHVPGVTPVAFSWKGGEVIAAGGSDGKLYLLDAKSMHTPLFQSDAIAPGGFRAAFATWEDRDSKERWLYASSADHVTGFKLEERAGKPVLTKAWVSPGMESPSAPVIANGLVFAVSSKGLHALDAATGQELYNSGSLVGAPARGGLAIANRRIYFTAEDNTVYCFGFLAEQPQLTGK